MSTFGGQSHCFTVYPAEGFIFIKNTFLLVTAAQPGLSLVNIVTSEIFVIKNRRKTNTQAESRMVIFNTMNVVIIFFMKILGEIKTYKI